MEISVLTANLAGAGPDTVDDLIAAIDRLSPDLVGLQEVRGVRTPPKVLDVIAERTGMLAEFVFGHDLSLDYGKGVLQEESVKEGMAVLFRERISLSAHQLPIIKGEDRWPRIAVSGNLKSLTFCAVHFSKHPESRALARAELPDHGILLGDLNMQPSEVEENFPEYTSGYAFQPYISYPSKGLTLDHVLIKRGSFTQVETVPLSGSDHVALFAKADIH